MIYVCDCNVFYVLNGFLLKYFAELVFQFCLVQSFEGYGKYTKTAWQSTHEAFVLFAASTSRVFEKVLYQKGITFEKWSDF